MYVKSDIILKAELFGGRRLNKYLRSGMKCDVCFMQNMFVIFQNYARISGTKLLQQYLNSVEDHKVSFVAY